MEITTVKHVSSGHTYRAEIYQSFVYLVDEMREISIEAFNDFFKIVDSGIEISKLTNN